MVASDPVSIDGGMTANRYFCQFLADVLQRRIIVSEQPEVTALGTASLAAEAAGLEIANTRTGTAVEPRARRTAARAAFASAIAAARMFSAT